MANPQKENGYTAIANEILEHLVNTALLGSEYSVILHILRKTYGFQKKKDKVSLTQFEKATGLSRPTVVKTLKNLVSKKILVKTALLEYSIEKDWERWVVNTALLVKHNDIGSKARLTETSKHGLTHKRKKEITKEIANTGNANALQGNQFGILLKEFEILNPVSNLYGNTTERKALDDMASRIGYDKLLATIKALPNIVNQPFAPKITKPTELKRDFGKLLLFVKQKGNKVEKYQAKSINI